jgi:hypothetical protein
MDQLIKLLRYCLGTWTDGKNAAGLLQLSPSDWDRVIEQSAWHGALPMLYQSAKALGPSISIADSVLQKLRDEYLRSALENLRRYQQLSELLRAFQNDGIPVIALKGVHLAEVVYRNIALRPMSDIDLLVKKEDLPRVEEEMFRLGYRYGPFAYTNKSWLAERAGNFAYVPANKGVLVEIHWSIGRPISPFNIDTEGLWERSHPITINGIPVSVLSPEDLLLHLCLHTAFRNAFVTGLLHFCDIAKVIQHYQDKLEWKQLRCRISQWGVARPVYLTLHLARELLRSAVPDEFLDKIRPQDFDRKMITWAREQIFNYKIAPQAVSPKLIKLWGSQRLKDKASLLLEALLILKNVFLSKEYIAYNYFVPPNSLRVYLYYVVSLKDVLLRYGGSAWRLLRRDEEMVTLAKRENAIRNWLESS